MNRNHRVALTVAGASALVVGAGAALTSGPLASGSPAAGQVLAQPVDQSLDPASAADPAGLHEAVSRLTAQTAALRAQLDAARRLRDEATAAAQKAAAQAAHEAAARAATASARPARGPRTTAPAVHTRTGASAATGESEGQDD